VRANVCHFFSDVTPNGSLRRRRSRVPSEEDDSNLMDFLRSSGHDGSRERKSWGSLGKIYVHIIFQVFYWSDCSDCGHLGFNSM
jgi:hypothetical protein